MIEKKTAGLVPKLRFPDFADAGGWQRHLIGRYLTESRIKGSGGHKAKKLTVKLWGKGVFEKSESVLGSANTQYYRRKSGQFIYSKLDFLNQAFGIVPAELDGYESTVDLPCFEISQEMNANFILEYVQRKQFYKKVGEIADGGRKAKRIQVETFLGFPIHVPSAPEQQKIAECLGSLDDLIAAESRKLDALRQQKKGLMQQLFPQPSETVPRLRFPEFQDAGEWEEKPLGKLLTRSPDYGVNAPAAPFSDKLPAYIRITDISEDGRFEPNPSVSVEIDATSDQYLQDGDILLVRTGASVGKSYRYDPSDGRLVHAGFLIRVRPNTDKLLPAYLSAFLTTTFYWDWVRYTSVRSGQPGINSNEYASLLIPLPTGPNAFAEQQKIADLFANLSDKISYVNQRTKTLKLHKQGLLQQLFPSLEDHKG